MVKNIHSLGNVEFNDFSSHSVREATCNDMQRKSPDVCVCVCRRGNLCSHGDKSQTVSVLTPVPTLVHLKWLPG